MIIITISLTFLTKLTFTKIFSLFLSSTVLLKLYFSILLIVLKLGSGVESCKISEIFIFKKYFY